MSLSTTVSPCPHTSLNRDVCPHLIQLLMWGVHPRFDPQVIHSVSPFNITKSIRGVYPFILTLPTHSAYPRAPKFPIWGACPCLLAGSSDSGQALLSSQCAAWHSPMLSSSATPSDTSSRLDSNDSLQYVRCCQRRLPHPVVSPGSEMLPFLVVPHFLEMMPHRRAAQLSPHLRSIIICAEDIDVQHWISAFLSLKQFWMGWQSILHLWQSHLLPWRRLHDSLRWCCRLDSQLRWAQIFFGLSPGFSGKFCSAMSAESLSCASLV